MDTGTHEWIDEYTSFEAVLSCKNQLGEWDSDAAARAFQTFGWNDVSTPGNGLSFSHEDTGILVHHDGGVIAIDFGDGRLSEALADLFAVLHALGWRLAEVFHPTETMASLLSDIGKAIPAQMDFDVAPAKKVIAISEFAEGATLVARGTAALQAGGMDAHSALVLGELVSMDPAKSDPIPLGQARGPIFLSDDAPDNETTTVEVAPAATAQSSRLSGAGFAFVDEQPQTFVLPPREEKMLGQDPIQRAPSVSEVHYEEHVGQGHDDVGSQEIQDQMAQPVPRDLPAEIQRTLDPVKAAEGAPRQLVAELPGEQVAAANLIDNFVRVGRSVFCFDLPHAPLSDDELKKFAEDLQPDDVVHLRPGALGESLRWDLFGEIASEFPWFAEKLASAMHCGPTARSFLTSVLLSLKKYQDRPQLRDLLLICQAFVSGADNDRTSVLNALPQETRRFVREEENLDRPNANRRALNLQFVQALDEVTHHFGGVLLCPDGQAFVDVRAAAGDAGGKAIELFTVGGVMQSATSRLFVVRLDELDGAFVNSAVALMHAVAKSYSATKRYSKAVEIKSERAAQIQQMDDMRQKLVADFSGVVGNLKAQLLQLGCEV